MNEQLIQFVREHTKHFDASHDINHVIAVYQNAVLIAKEELPDYDDDILQHACLLHDVCDHKYANALPRHELHKYINQKLCDEKAQVVIDVIDNMSFSQEVKGLRKKLNTPYQDIVSDADKLEALGEGGLERCIVFTEEIGGDVPSDVVKHCHDKLLKLKDFYIRTNTGKAMAEPLHQVIADYVLITSEQ
jgi:uncharacterized protein